MEPVAASAAARAPSVMSPAEERRLRATAHEVESIFLQHLLKTMRQASGSTGTLLTGTGQRVYQEMMDEQLGRTLSKGGGIGLADMLVRDVLRRQESAKMPSSPPGEVPIGGAGGLP
jgi:Rod binding domain-containing protein